MRDFLLFWIISIELLCISMARGRPKKICPDFDLKRIFSEYQTSDAVEVLEEFKACEVIEGHVAFGSVNIMEDSDFANYTFRNLTEITDYLLVWRVAGLRSLRTLFPNLAIIRGNSLFLNYGLVVYENAQLENIGLDKLTHVSRGSIMIRNNYQCCFIETIDWNALLFKPDGNRTIYEISIGRNGKERECQSAKKCEASGCGSKQCWSGQSCQIVNNDNYTCSQLCAGGCDKNGPCLACNTLTAENGTCILACPEGSFPYLNTRCITKEECLEMPLISNSTLARKKVIKKSYFVYNGKCVEKCPMNYYRTEDSKCLPCPSGVCEKECVLKDIFSPRDSVKITTVDDAEKLWGCTRIVGTLEVSIYTGTYYKGIEEALAENLCNVREIYGQLKVINSRVTSLNFFRNLKKIRVKRTLNNIEGQSNYDEFASFALIVKGNEYLEQLWDWKKRPPIEITEEVDDQAIPANVTFYKNPMLCFNEIEDLYKNCGLPRNDELNIIKQYNGLKKICNHDILTVQIVSKRARSIKVQIQQAPNEMTPLERFTVYYRENDGSFSIKSVLIQPGYDCEDSKWNVLDIINSAENIRRKFATVELTELKPYTEYVFFVQTYSIATAIRTSRIHYVKTLPYQPSSPTKVWHSIDKKTNDVTLHWLPPVKPNGIISEYLVRGHGRGYATKALQDRDYCAYSSLYDTNADSITLGTFSEDSRCAVACGKKETPHNPSHLCTNVEMRGLSEWKDFCQSYAQESADDLKNLLFDEYDNMRISFAFFDENFRLNPEENFHSYENVTGKDDRLEEFAYTAQDTSITLTNLRAFSHYQIYISACRERDTNLNDRARRCSLEVNYGFETPRLVGADVVTNLRVTSSHIRDISISWDEPRLANGFVHSYQIQYRSIGSTLKGLTERCVTAANFRKNNFTFRIVDQHLMTGEIMVQVRAMSLASLTSETVFVSFTFDVTDDTMEWTPQLIFTLLASFVAFSILIAYGCVRRSTIIELYLGMRRQAKKVITPPPPVTTSFEMNRENIQLLRFLGRGHFGEIHKARLKDSGRYCAVKLVSQGDEEFKNESSLMMDLVRAPRVVKLLGVVTVSRPKLLIMELMECGDLKTYILCNKNELMDVNQNLSDQHGLNIAADVADGMAYLGAKKVLHRDLAARNCLVMADGTVKISDFGLSREVSTKNYYRRLNHNMLPVRWMAPESFLEHKFTLASDVWSYGVLLWELHTFCEMPYSPMAPKNVISYVLRGKTLKVNPSWNPLLTAIMRACWCMNPRHRPTFLQILQHLENFCDEKFVHESFYYHRFDYEDDVVDPDDPCLQDPIPQYKLRRIQPSDEFVSPITEMTEEEVNEAESIPFDDNWIRFDSSDDNHYRVRVDVVNDDETDDESTEDYNYDDEDDDDYTSDGVTSHHPESEFSNWDEYGDLSERLVSEREDNEERRSRGRNSEIKDSAVVGGKNGDDSATKRTSEGDNNRKGLLSRKNNERGACKICNRDGEKALNSCRFDSGNENEQDDNRGADQIQKIYENKEVIDPLRRSGAGKEPNKKTDSGNKCKGNIFGASAIGSSNKGKKGKIDSTNIHPGMKLGDSGYEEKLGSKNIRPGMRTTDRGYDEKIASGNIIRAGITSRDSGYGGIYARNNEEGVEFNNEEMRPLIPEKIREGEIATRNWLGIKRSVDANKKGASKSGGVAPVKKTDCKKADASKDTPKTTKEGGNSDEFSKADVSLKTDEKEERKKEQEEITFSFGNSENNSPRVYYSAYSSPSHISSSSAETSSKKSKDSN